MRKVLAVLVAVALALMGLGLNRVVFQDKPFLPSFDRSAGPQEAPSSAVTCIEELRTACREAVRQPSTQAASATAGKLPAGIWVTTRSWAEEAGAEVIGEVASAPLQVGSAFANPAASCGAPVPLACLVEKHSPVLLGSAQLGGFDLDAVASLVDASGQAAAEAVRRPGVGLPASVSTELVRLAQRASTFPAIVAPAPLLVNVTATPLDAAATVELVLARRPGAKTGSTKDLTDALRSELAASGWCVSGCPAATRVSAASRQVARTVWG